MMIKLKYVLPIIIVMTVFSSCEEVIEIDLNSVNPVIVAEGYIFEDSLSYLNLSYTADYFHDDTPVLIEDAIVTLNDDKGNSETLSHMGGGRYSGSIIYGQPNTNYTISMEIGDQVFNGSSRMLPPAEIFSILYAPSIFQRPGPPAAPGTVLETSYTVTLTLLDHPQEKNYYLLNFLKNGEAQTDTYITINDDFASPENLISFPTFMFEYFLGDTVGISVVSIDEDAYWFYNQLNDAVYRGPVMSATPYNAISNFGENVLGYFMARSRMDTVVVLRGQ